MAFKTWKRSVAVGSAAAIATLGLGAGTALADGNGSTTTTLHAHGAEAYDLEVADFITDYSTGASFLPAGCWLPETDALMSTYGNAVFHVTVNKAQDDWLTTTFTGEGAAYPIVFQSGWQPQLDGNDNDVVDTSAAPLATGHFTIWFGAADNNQNELQHATLTFNGNLADGTPVGVSGLFHFSTDANGGMHIAGPPAIHCTEG